MARSRLEGRLFQCTGGSLEQALSVAQPTRVVRRYRIHRFFIAGRLTGPNASGRFDFGRLLDSGGRQQDVRLQPKQPDP
jgi:hypothetical protein